MEISITADPCCIIPCVNICLMILTVKLGIQYSSQRSGTRVLFQRNTLRKVNNSYRINLFKIDISLWESKYHN